MKDSRDDRVYTDDDGTEHYRDSDGKVHLGVPPLFTSKVKRTVSGWREYDTSQGHCGLCGSIKCNGGCFK